jgi:hypothetical protein
MTRVPPPPRAPSRPLHRRTRGPGSDHRRAYLLQSFLAASAAAGVGHGHGSRLFLRWLRSWADTLSPSRAAGRPRSPATVPAVRPARPRRDGEFDRVSASRTRGATAKLGAIGVGVGVSSQGRRHHHAPSLETPPPARAPRAAAAAPARHGVGAYHEGLAAAPRGSGGA